MDDIIYFVIPCYNEEEVLLKTADKLKNKLYSLLASGLANTDSRILFVDDGSKDKTWQLIEELSKEDPIFTGIKLSRNKGHQNALLAGLMTAKQYAYAVISMDADLQDDIEVLDQFLIEYYKGNEIVYGVRSCRNKDTFFKRFTAEWFYKLMILMGVDIVFNHADYRLMSKRALCCLEQFREVNLFLRGIVPVIGLKSTTVSYERGERAGGISKYPLKKMLTFAFDGMTSFSVKPLRLIAALGMVVTCISAVAFICILVGKMFGSTNLMVSGTVCSLWVLGGIQLLSLGIIGEYIGKIYAEVKDRPRYMIENDLSIKHCNRISKNRSITRCRKFNH